MHIVCDQCQTKYVVPDEKIEKNTLRFTCQKCGHVITQRVADPAPEPPAPSNTLNKWRNNVPNTPRKLQAELPKWYYSVNGESIGPFTEDDLKSKLLSDKMTDQIKQCYVWCKNFTDWKPVLEVEPFASALTQPVPPPPPMPAPLPPQDGPLPPLFKDSAEHPGLSSILSKPKSSPDLPGLKHRLQKNSATQLAAQQREALAKLAGVSLTSIEPPELPEDQALTDEDETRTHAPLLTDIIPPAEKPSTSASHAHSKPFSVSNLPPIGGRSGSVKPLGSAQTGARPAGISPLSGGLPKSSNPLPKLGSIPKPLSSSANNKALDLQSGIAKPIPSSANSKALSTGNLPKPAAAEKSNPVSATASATSEPPSLDLDIDLNEQSGLSSTASEVLPDIDLDDDVSRIANRPADLRPPEAAQTEASEDLPLDLDLEDSELIPNAEVNEAISESGEYASANDQHLLSSAQVLSMMHHTKAAAAPASQDAPASADIAEIDLDEDNSQFIEQNEIDAITNDPNAPKISGIMSADTLFNDTNNEPAVARARAPQTKLDEIAARHADLFAELEAAEPEPDEDDDGVSEHSMLIQLEHFNKIQQKEKTKRNFKLIGAIAGAAAILLIIAVISGFVISNKQHEENTKVVQNTPSLKVEGREITLDEIDVAIPEDDFEIIPVAPQKSSRSHRKSQAEQPDALADTKEIDKSATEAASEAIYGENSDTKTETQAAVKHDGRANVVLAKTDDFGSTAGVQGSKKTKSAPSSSREKLLAGLKTVSKSVQNCSQRAAKQGITLPEKIYINLTVLPAGSVDAYEIDTSNVPDIFNKCLDSKKDTWHFEPFEGDPIHFRQSFILG